MNKRELVETVAAEAGISVRTSEAALEAVVDTIGRALARGDRVTVPGLGTFETRSRAARTGRNPQTGRPIEIAARTTPAFKPATALKQAVSASDGRPRTP